MYLKIICQNSENGDVYDITNIVSDIQISTELYDNAGKLTFITQRQNESDDTQIAVFEEGSTIQISWKEKGIFMGYVFKRQTDRNGTVKITAYDQLRYLKNKDWYRNGGETLATTFTKLCNKFNLRSQVLSDSGYKVPPKIFDDAAIYEILKYSMDCNLVGTKKIYIIYDDYGILKLNNVENMRTDYIFGDKSMVTEYRYEKSIDENTYNMIKLVKEDKENKIRNNYITKDSDNQKRWGILQYYKKVDEHVPEGMMKQWGENLLNTYNVATEKLTLNAIATVGDDEIWNIRAGSGIIVRINTAIGHINGKNEADKYEMFLIESCTHAIQNENYHSLTLDVIKVSPTKQQEKEFKFIKEQEK
ncbi:MAG: hypothetical protein RR420_05540 [Anaerovoracaceae bacterium]